MTTVGLCDLRQNAADLVRRVEAGEEITITVSGRPSARMVPARAATWRPWAEIAELFHGSVDADRPRDRALLDTDVSDPWAGQ